MERGSEPTKSVLLEIGKVMQAKPSPKGGFGHNNPEIVGEARSIGKNLLFKCRHRREHKQ